MSALRTALLAAFLLLVPATQAFAGNEKITSFRSDIKIRPDSVVEVTETIEVVAAGEQIKHGIYRDFPTIYRDRQGNLIKVGFHLKQVRRDGQNIFRKVEALPNGKRIYMGDPGVLIAPGSHSFVLGYEVDRELGYFADYDEFYWNVTGNGWVFPIDHAEAAIELPPGAKVLQQAGYTGYSGSTERAYAVTENSGNRIAFATTRGLKPREGLTVAVGWPKGFVKEPTPVDRALFLLLDNFGLAFGVVSLGLLLIYYFVSWRMVKAEEPDAETVIPLFAPPKDIPAAAASFIVHKDMHDKTLPAAIISMAVSGCLKIAQQNGGGLLSGNHFQLERTGSFSALPEVEKATAHALFSAGDTLALKQGSHAILQRAKAALQEGLKAAFRDEYFSDNFRVIKKGVFFTFLSGLVVLAAASLPFALIIIMSMVFLDVLFLFLVKTYTRRGREVVTEIEGFKMFLSVTETERFNLLHPPEVTPELFEKYFPYAVALGVENEWGEKFSRYLTAKGLDPQSYHPGWYHSSHPVPLRQLTSSLGSGFSSAISSSSTPPGHSSGSGGRGASGRGGGGGGGGGF